MPHKDPDAKKAYHSRKNREWYAKNRERLLAEHKLKLRTDPEFKARMLERSKRHYAKNREAILERQKRRRIEGAGERRPREQMVRRRILSKERMRRYRLAAIARMGGCCEVCGISDERVLQFDHRVAVKKKKHPRASSSHREILKMGRPETVYALLCANCHVIKTRSNREYRSEIEPVSEERVLH